MTQPSRPRKTAVIARVLALACILFSGVPACPEAHVPPELPARPRQRFDLKPQDRPDIAGYGKITRAGNVWLKSTNIGVIGNPFTAISSDPSAQWSGPSGIEYLFYVGLWVGAVDPTTIDPSRRWRVSASTEWRPRSAAPEDHIYESHPRDPNGEPYVDDDHDGRLDEDPPNGIDDDVDGLVDEDGSNAADQQFTCVMRDDQPEAIEAATQEQHVPLGLQVRQTTYTFAAPDLRDVVYVEHEIENVSGHTLDSVYVAYFVDQDVGPLDQSHYFTDDIPEPQIPQGPDPTLVPTSFDDPLSPNFPFREVVSPDDPKYQATTDNNGRPISLCPVDTFYLNGFTMTDDDGDGGRTPGASSFLLLDHPTDLLGVKAPPHVHFHMYKYYTAGGLTFDQGGLPTNDRERYQVISAQEGVDPVTGLIRAQRPTRPDDYVSICSVGPFLQMKPGEKIRVVWAVAIQKEDRSYERSDRRHRYGAIIDNALHAMLAYRGRLEHIPLIPSPSGPGRETGLTAAPGQDYDYWDCRDLAQSPPNIRRVTSTSITWFDLDCNFCTGVADHTWRHWVAPHPPPNANTKLVPGDNRVTVQWDNLPEYTVDPDRHEFDFAGYHVWKASSWKRPEGEIGPDEPLWELLASYRYYSETNPLVERVVAASGETLTVKTPNVLLDRSWRPGSSLPRLVHASDVPCLPGAADSCDVATGTMHVVASTGADSMIAGYRVIKYPPGRWQLDDHDVHNGFLYFYSVTAYDSSGRSSSVLSFEGRRAAIQTEGVTPQAAWSASFDGGKPFVVPNPYRAHASWDLAPDATDPTGTHVDFMNLPADWTRVRIYTLSGDLVQEILAGDARVDGHLQKETASDQEATWNLLSRNGQDVASGIYLFTVETGRGEGQQGRFAVIR